MIPNSNLENISLHLFSQNINEIYFVHLSSINTKITEQFSFLQLFYFRKDNRGKNREFWTFFFLLFYFSPQADRDNGENNESSSTSQYGLEGLDREGQSGLYGVPVRVVQQRLQA